MIVSNSTKLIHLTEVKYTSGNLLGPEMDKSGAVNSNSYNYKWHTTGDGSEHVVVVSDRDTQCAVWIATRSIYHKYIHKTIST